MDNVIRSLQNTKIKNAIKLRDRRGRDAQGRTIIDGLREIGRALTSRFPVQEVFTCRGVLETEDAGWFLEQLRDHSDVDTTEVSREVLEKLSFGQRVEGAVAVADIPGRKLDDLQLSTCPLVVVLEQVEKPGNLGAVLRTMDAVGAEALILADGRTDPFNPNAIRASAGTIFSMPMAQATVDQTMRFLAERKIQMLAAKVDGSVPYTDADFRQPTAMILGSEATGLTEAWNVADVAAIHLPMRGISDSLNVSITAAVLLYEALRQRGLST